MLILIPVFLIVGVTIYGFVEINRIKRKLKGYEGQVQFFSLQIEEMKAKKKEAIRELENEKKKPKIQYFHHPQLGDKEIKA